MSQVQTHVRELLKERVDILNTDSWIIPIVYGSDKLMIDLNDYLKRRGLDVGLMTFPAVLKNEARIRIFITSEHSREQIETASSLLIEAAHKFGFQKRVVVNLVVIGESRNHPNLIVIPAGRAGICRRRGRQKPGGSEP